ncbi:MAG: response regulator [Chloroflexota bacterium]
MTRVLVVDDEIDTLNLLRTILEISGYEAFTTLNSVDAITLAEVEHPDLILLDIMMPLLDGFTLCKMMRLHPATVNLPIVFVTAYSALDLEDRRKEAGADMVLPKPIGMDMLIEAVEHATSARTALKVAPPPPAPVATPTPIVESKPAATPEPAKPVVPQPTSQPTLQPPATPTVSATPPIPSVEMKPDSASTTPQSNPNGSQPTK